MTTFHTISAYLVRKDAKAFVMYVEHNGSGRIPPVNTDGMQDGIEVNLKWENADQLARKWLFLCEDTLDVMGAEPVSQEEVSRMTASADGYQSSVVWMRNAPEAAAPKELNGFTYSYDAASYSVLVSKNGTNLGQLFDPGAKKWRQLLCGADPIAEKWHTENGVLMISCEEKDTNGIQVELTAEQAQVIADAFSSAVDDCSDAHWKWKNSSLPGEAAQAECWGDAARSILHIGVTHGLLGADRDAMHFADDAYDTTRYAYLSGEAMGELIDRKNDEFTNQEWDACKVDNVPTREQPISLPLSLSPSETRILAEVMLGFVEKCRDVWFVLRLAPSFSENKIAFFMALKSKKALIIGKQLGLIRRYAVPGESA